MVVDGKRIGPCMLAATRFVASNPGCPKLPVAEHVGPHGSRAFGWRTIDRAIRAGLINAGMRPGNGFVYSLTLTPFGERVAQS